MSGRKAIIKKGFAGVSDTDFVKRKFSAKSKGANGEQVYTADQKHAMFLDKLNSWLRANCAQLIDTFQQYDQKGSGHVAKEQFGEGLVAMKAPLSKQELAMVVKFLTPHRCKIDYLSFARGVEIPFPTKDSVEVEAIKLSVRDLSGAPCAKCKLKFPPTERAEIRPRYINMTLELIQFLERDIPCNFTRKITATLTLFGVKQLVQETFSYSLLDLEVYEEKTGNSGPLPNNLTMAELGYKGGTFDSPQEVVLFYDVHVNVHVNIDVTHPFYACPLLLTDYYFARHATQQQPPLANSIT